MKHTKEEIINALKIIKEVGCYGCIYYGTHHSDPENKENGLYECEGCDCEGVGHDLVKWLNKEVSKND